MNLPDLDRHGIVEAHAGTGKTYTIVAMVVELLSRERLELRDILLVTYTQKAAGELAERIRHGIAEATATTDDESLRVHLRNCLGQLGECWIGTIHGVALRILRAWPFESGLPFRTELVDDAEGLDSALRAIWRRDPFRLSDEDASAFRGGRRMEKILESARRLANGALDPDAVVLPSGFDAPEAFDALRVQRKGLPDERAGLAARVAETESVFLAGLEASMREAERVDASTFSKKFTGRWNTCLGNWRKCLGASQARSRTKLFGTGKPIAESLSNDDRSNHQALEAARIWNERNEAWTNALEADCARLDELDEAMESIDKRLRAGVLSGWATLAAREWKERKRSEGLLSYQDMLEKLRDAVFHEPFRRELRKRIRVGIIDEFQDTSALQWDIFRHWFVDDNPARDPRLFLVGDPKQSIYSFQAADVRTYLQACRDLEKAGGARFQLRHNWRSTPELVGALNGLLAKSTWFTPDIAYDVRNEVLAPDRAAPSEPSANSWIGEPVRIAVFDGSAGARRAAYARHVANTILSMRGRTVVLPKGDAWQEKILDWGDFAVAVQARSSVASFRRAFRRAGIPFSLYKEAGVFSSRAALEFAGLLSALVEPPSANRRKLRALLTRFFGVAPEELDPARHLAEDAPASLAFERLARRAMEGRWPSLFREILSATGVQGRILSESDGDRDWMDLRQTMAHALEFLVLGRGGIHELLEHLDRLAQGEETAAEDRNLHARATDRERVRILTMHVSKGLEFPVVFLSPSQDPKGRDESRWIEESEGRLRLHVAPKDHERDDGNRDPTVVQALEETGRILYVAITRPKLLLEMPFFARSNGKPDNLLAKHLAPAVEGNSEGVAVLHPTDTQASHATTDGISRDIAPPEHRDVATLRLSERSLVLSSYSALSRAASSPGLEGRPNRSEETENAPATAPAILPDAWLPRGTSTGDALHELLESLLRQDDLSWCADEAPAWLLRDAESSLSAQGLDRTLAPRVARLLLDVLASPLPLPGGGQVRLADLPKGDRRPEVEFHCAFDREGNILLPGRISSSAPRKGWLVGYIDLLFRHEGVWYVLDWKTTTLPGWDEASLREGMREHDYELQAALYTRVVGEALPSVPCGGAVYVFLRASAGSPVPKDAPLPGVWTSPATGREPHLVRSRLEGWMQRRRNPSSRSEEP